MIGILGIPWQIIATSAEVTPNCPFRVRDSPPNPLLSGLGIIIMWGITLPNDMGIISNYYMDPKRTNQYKEMSQLF